MIKENAKRLSLLKVVSDIRTSKLFWIVTFSILTAVAAQITIPVRPVPFTLQAMMVLLAGAFLGSKNGAYSQILYLAMGVIGLPVFAQTPDGAIGFARLFGPTGGYLLAFPAAAFLTGYIIEKNENYFVVVAGMFAGYLLIITSGVLYLTAFYLHSLSDAFIAGAAVFSVWMVLKVLTAATIYSGSKKALK